MESKSYNYLAAYIDRLQSAGRYTFAWPELVLSVGRSSLGLKKSLNRLVRKGRLVILQKEFYCIVPAEYSSIGVMPPLLFIDDYMSFLHKPYYIGLLSAAAMHGSAHQQPQEFYVIHAKPARRPIIKKNIRINFVTKNQLPRQGIEKRKSDTGMVCLSGPELTAYDLVYFFDRAGGWDRCLAILAELVEQLNPKTLSLLVSEQTAVAPWQRLGFALEFLLNKPILADALFEAIKGRLSYFYPLNPHQKKKGYSAGNRWKIINNYSVEKEE